MVDFYERSGKPRWNREAIDKLLSNEKYTGRMLLQKTISVGGSKMRTDGFIEYLLFTETHMTASLND